MTAKAMDLLAFCRKVDSNEGACKVLRSVDTRLCESYASVMLDLFREIVRQEHINAAQFLALKQAYGEVARGAMRYLDSCGATAVIAEQAQPLAQVSYADSACVLAYEATYLHNMGVPYEKIVPFWRFVDEHKGKLLERMRKPGFALEALVDPAVKSFGTEKGGAEWEHLSPGFWRRMAGFGLAVVNCVATVPTAGIAVASVIAGAAGVAAG
jgi:hypothetical protein